MDLIPRTKQLLQRPDAELAHRDLNTMAETLEYELDSLAAVAAYLDPDAAAEGAAAASPPSLSPRRAHCRTPASRLPQSRYGHSSSSRIRATGYPAKCG